MSFTAASAAWATEKLVVGVADVDLRRCIVDNEDAVDDDAMVVEIDADSLLPIVAAGDLK